MEENKFDYEKLRHDLLDFFGTAMVNVSRVAMMDLSRVNKATNEELLMIANECGFDLNEYLLGYKRFYRR